jgi:hypothetical protein
MQNHAMATTRGETRENEEKGLRDWRRKGVGGVPVLLILYFFKRKKKYLSISNFFFRKKLHRG